jgi:hypothetical protein
VKEKQKERCWLPEVPRGGMDFFASLAMTAK